MDQMKRKSQRKRKNRDRGVAVMFDGG